MKNKNARAFKCFPGLESGVVSIGVDQVMKALVVSQR